MERKVLHIHIPCFQISLERLKDNSLRYRPVAVVSSPSDRGIVISPSPEARAEGVFKGMRCGEAKRLCPGLIYRLPDPSLVEGGMMAIGLIAKRYTPLWELERPGHLYLDLGGTERLWGKAQDTGVRIIKEIKGEIGPCACSGLGSNKLVGQVASFKCPPMEVREVKCGEESSFMAPMEIDVIPALSHKERAFIKKDLGIERVFELVELGPSYLSMILGKKAHLVYEQARGIDHTPVYPFDRGPLVEEAIVLPEETNEDRVLLAHLFSLLERCMESAQEKELGPKSGGFFIRFRDHSTIVRNFKVNHPVPLLLFRFIEPLFLQSLNRRIGVKELRLWLRCVCSYYKSKPVFELLSGQSLRLTRLSSAIREIRGRYGRGIIHYGLAISRA